MGRKVSQIAFFLFLVLIVIVWFFVKDMKQVPPVGVREQEMAPSAAPREVRKPESRPDSAPTIHSFGSSR